MNELGFCQNPTKLIIGPFWGLFGWAVLIHQNIFPKFTHTTYILHCLNITNTEKIKVVKMSLENCHHNIFSIYVNIE